MSPHCSDAIYPEKIHLLLSKDDHNKIWNLYNMCKKTVEYKGTSSI